MAASLGTTILPLMISILRRGEWSMRIVLDAYFHFAQAGNYYLGRILAMLDLFDPSFATLPPY